MGRPVGAVGPKVGAARGRVPFVGQSYEILRDSAAARPFFLHRPTVVRRAPRPLFPPRLVRSKSYAFSVSVPQFFRCSPALFSFGGRVAPSAGVKCAASHACVTRTRPSFFDFCLHRFTSSRQYTHKQAVTCEGFTLFCLHPCLHPLPPRARRPDRGVKTAAR